MSLYPCCSVLVPVSCLFLNSGFGFLVVRMTRYLEFGLGSLALLEQLVNPENNKTNGNCDNG